jgi:hypothetical protein
MTKRRKQPELMIWQHSNIGVLAPPLTFRYYYSHNNHFSIMHGKLLLKMIAAIFQAIYLPS